MRTNLELGMKNVPVFVTIDGAKTQVGTGEADPVTGLFTFTVDDSPNGELAANFLADQEDPVVYMAEVNFMHEIDTRPPITTQDD